MFKLFFVIPVNLFLQLSILMMVINPSLSYAQTITVDGSAPRAQRPSLGKSSTGKPTINIVAPKAGVSHNRYKTLSTNSGIIFNNSKVGGRTQTGGSVGANKNLAKAGSAKVIVNEVRGRSNSSLKGSLEVFGSKADVIIANENGVSCDGCSFVNTGRATLSSGQVTVKNGSVSLRVRQGDVQVGRGGMTGADIVNLSGRHVIVDGKIVAKQAINLSGGSQYFDPATGRSRAAPSDKARKAPFAVDATAFGALSAGNIRVIGNESGLGVRLNGKVNAKTDINVSSRGDVSIRNFSSGRDTRISSSGVTRQYKGHGTVGRNLNVSAKSVETSVGAKIVVAGNAAIHASQALVVAGEIRARDISLSSNKSTVNLGSVISAEELTIVAGDISNRRSVTQTTKSQYVGWIQRYVPWLKWYTARYPRSRYTPYYKYLLNSSVRKIADQQTLGPVAVLQGKDVSLTARSGSVTNEAVISAVRSLSISAALDIRNQPQQERDRQSNGRYKVTKHKATIAAYNTHLVAGRDVANTSVLKLSGNVDILAKAGSIGGIGRINSQGFVRLTSNGAISTVHDITARSNISLTSSRGSITNTGKLNSTGGGVSLWAYRNITSSNSIAAATDVNLTARYGSLANRHYISAGRDANLWARYDLYNYSTVAKRHAKATAYGGTLTNRYRIYGYNTLTATAGKDLVNQGYASRHSYLYGGYGVTLSAGANVKNIGARIWSYRDINIAAGTTYGGSIINTGIETRRVSRKKTGRVYGTEVWKTVDIGSWRESIIKSHGSGKLNLAAYRGNVENTGSVLDADKGALSIYASGRIALAGKGYSDKTTVLTRKWYSYKKRKKWYQKKKTYWSYRDSTNVSYGGKYKGSMVNAGTDLSLNAGSDLTVRGGLKFGRNIALTSRSGVLTLATAIDASNGYAALSGGKGINVSRDITARSNISLTSSRGSITNTGKLNSTGGGVSLWAYRNITSSNSIAAATDVNLTARYGSLANRHYISAGRDANLWARYDLYNYSTVAKRHAKATAYGGTLTNRYRIYGYNTLTATAGKDLVNQGYASRHSYLYGGYGVTLSAGANVKNIGARIWSYRDINIAAGTTYGGSIINTGIETRRVSRKKTGRVYGTEVWKTVDIGSWRESIIKSHGSGKLNLAAYRGNVENTGSVLDADKGALSIYASGRIALAGKGYSDKTTVLTRKWYSYKKRKKWYQKKKTYWSYRDSTNVSYGGKYKGSVVNAGTDLSLNAGSDLTVRGGLKFGRNIALTSRSGVLTLATAIDASNGYAALSGGKGINVSRDITARSNISLTSSRGSITNTGKLNSTGGGVSLWAYRNITSSNSIAAATDVNLTARYGSLANRHYISAGRDANLWARYDLYNYSTVAKRHAKATAYGGTLTNRYRIYGYNTLTATAGKDLVNQGYASRHSYLYGGYGVTLSAGANVKNIGARIWSYRDINIAAGTTYGGSIINTGIETRRVSRKKTGRVYGTEVWKTVDIGSWRESIIKSHGSGKLNLAAYRGNVENTGSVLDADKGALSIYASGRIALAGKGYSDKTTVLTRKWYSYKKRKKWYQKKKTYWSYRDSTNVSYGGKYKGSVVNAGKSVSLTSRGDIKTAGLNLTTGFLNVSATKSAVFGSSSKIRVAGLASFNTGKSLTLSGSWIRAKDYGFGKTSHVYLKTDIRQTGSSDLKLNFYRHVTNQGTLSARDIVLASQWGTVANTGTVSATRDVALISSRNKTWLSGGRTRQMNANDFTVISNRGVVKAGRNAVLSGYGNVATSFVNARNVTVQSLRGDVTATGALLGRDTANVYAYRNVEVRGILADDVSLTAKYGSLTAKGWTSADGSNWKTGRTTFAARLASDLGSYVNSQDVLNRQFGVIHARNELGIEVGKSLTLSDGATLSAEGDLAIQSRYDIALRSRQVGNTLRRSAILAGGDLTLNAGRDVVNSSGTISSKGNLIVSAGRNVINDALKTTFTLTSAHGCEGRACGRQGFKYTAAEMLSGEGLIITAGNNVYNKASQIAAAGAISIHAGNAIVNSAKTGQYNIVDVYKKKKFLWVTISKLVKNNNKAVLESGVIQTEFGDILLKTDRGTIYNNGSFISSGSDVDIDAGRDVQFNATAMEVHNVYKKRGFSGFLTYSSNKTYWNNFVTAMSSVEGMNVNVRAGRNVAGIGATLMALNDLTLTADQDVMFDAKQNQKYLTEKGWSFGLTSSKFQITQGLLKSGNALQAYLADNPALAAVHELATAKDGWGSLNGSLALIWHGSAALKNAGVQFGKAASFDGLGKSLADQFIPSDYKDAKNLFAACSGGGAGVQSCAAAAGIGFRFDMWESRKEWTETHISRLGSGNDLVITAGRDVALVGGTASSAARDFDIWAGRDFITSAVADNSRTKSSGWGINVSVSQSGVTVGGNANGSKSQQTIFTNSHLSAGRDFYLTTGRDAKFLGAVAKAQNIYFDIGRDLTIASRQNTSKNSSWGFNASVTFTGTAITGFSLGGNYGKGSRAYTDTPTWLEASNEFDIYTGRTTYLMGAVINSKARKLKLDTGVFVFDDFRDREKQINVGGGISVNLNDPKGFSGSFNGTYRNKKGITYATVGGGQIIVRSNPNQDLSRVNTDINNVHRVTKNQYVNIKIPGINLRTLRENLAGAGNFIRAATAGVPEEVKTRGSQAATLYRKMLVNGLTAAEANKIAGTPDFLEAVEARNNIEVLKKKYGSFDEIPREILAAIAVEEMDLYLDADGNLKVSVNCEYFGTDCEFQIKDFLNLKGDIIEQMKQGRRIGRDDNIARRFRNLVLICIEENDMTTLMTFLKGLKDDNNKDKWHIVRQFALAGAISQHAKLTGSLGFDDNVLVSAIEEYENTKNAKLFEAKIAHAQFKFAQDRTKLQLISQVLALSSSFYVVTAIPTAMGEAYVYYIDGDYFAVGTTAAGETFGLQVKVANKVGKVILEGVGVNVGQKIEIAKSAFDNLTKGTQSRLKTFTDWLKAPNTTVKPGLLPTELSKAIRTYGSEVQKITGYKLTGKQGNLIKTALQNADYSKPLSAAGKKAHRAEFNKSKSTLINDWESNTGQKWPTYGSNPPTGRTANAKWDAHELIPNQNGGPIKWWNISPARFPDQHQAGIHGANGAFNNLMKKIGN